MLIEELEGSRAWLFWVAGLVIIMVGESLDGWSGEVKSSQESWEYWKRILVWSSRSFLRRTPLVGEQLLAVGEGMSKSSCYGLRDVYCIFIGEGKT